MEEEEGIAETPQQLIPLGVDMTKKKELDNMQKGNNMQNDGTVKPKPKNQNNVQKTDDPPQSEPGTSVQKENSAEANKDQANSSKDESSTPQDFESESGSSEESEAANNMQNKRKQTGSQPKPTRVFFKQYHCLSSGCKVTKQTKAAVVKHKKECHKDYWYRCSKCPQTFASWIGHYKHKKRHVGKAYICDECGRSFQFPGELDEHTHLHTGEDLVPCRYCDNSYPSKRAHNLHEKSHTDPREYVCDFKEKDGNICRQICVTPTHLKQHQ